MICKGCNFKLAIAILIMMFLSACQDFNLQTPKPQLQGNLSISNEEEPFNQLQIVTSDDKGAITIENQALTIEAFSYGELDYSKPPQPAELPADKLDPSLANLINTLTTKGATSTREYLIIGFNDNVTIPRFPALDGREPRDSVYNQQILTRIANLITDLQQQREPLYKRMTEELENQYEARVIDSFWLISAVVVEMPVGHIMSLLRHSEIRYIEPLVASPPPATVSTGRALIGSDPFHDFAISNGDVVSHIALIDTGVRRTHIQIGSDTLGVRRQINCAAGGAFNYFYCDSSTNYQTLDPCNHGTSSAAILTANSSQGSQYRGVTPFTIDSLITYRPSDCLSPSNTVVEAFQKAIELGDRVIIAEQQQDLDDTSNVSFSADNAFDAGHIVIAANGNFGPNAGSVRSPANSHKTLGVGAVYASDLTTLNSQGRGPTGDGRIKPDIQTPTCTGTASSASDSALRSCFSGTSGATPYAGGVAALLYNWHRINNNYLSIDPGRVYVHMILAGNQPNFNNTLGAGLLKVTPPTGTHVFSKPQITTTSQTITVWTINVSSSTVNRSINAAIWWPEAANQTHNDIDLRIIDPNGTTVDTSISVSSVFEKVRVNAPLTPGIYKVQVTGFSVPRSPQTVYFAGSWSP